VLATPCWSRVAAASAMAHCCITCTSGARCRGCTGCISCHTAPQHMLTYMLHRQHWSWIHMLQCACGLHRHLPHRWARTHIARHQHQHASACWLVTLPATGGHACCATGATACTVSGHSSCRCGATYSPASWFREPSSGACISRSTMALVKMLHCPCDGCGSSGHRCTSSFLQFCCVSL
jgi:hypothetical protein